MPQRNRHRFFDPYEGSRGFRALLPAAVAVSLAFAAPRASAADPKGSEPVCPASEKLDRSSLLLELRLEGDLRASGSAARECAGRGDPKFVPGKHGQAASFDGRSWVDTGLLQDALGPEFTVECWVKPADRQNTYADIFGNHVPQGLGFVLQQDGANTNQFLAAYGAGAGRWVVTPAVPLVAERWQHVALVKAAGTLKLYVNGVLAAEELDPAPASPSPMPVAVGLGYEDPARCFRGLIDEFRIWKSALEDFGHASIDPADAQEVRSQVLSDALRPGAREPVKSWTLSTDDTRLTVGVSSDGELSVREISCPAVGWNWIARPVPVSLFPFLEIDGSRRTPRWRFAGAEDGPPYGEPVAGERGGRRLTFRFACDDPNLEATVEWTARFGPGPIELQMRLRNASSSRVAVGEQTTFDLDVAGASALWRFHTDGGTPDPIGVYRDAIGTGRGGRRISVKAAPTGEFIPFVVLDSGRGHGVYLGLEWSFCRIETVELAGAEPPALRVRAGNIADLRVELAPGEFVPARPGFIGAYRGDLDDAGNRLRRWLFRYRIPEILRRDSSYPKVQWNAFGATGKTPGSWDPVESKYGPLIDAIAPLGFEEVMIDVGWWEGAEPDPDPVDWPSGMRKAAEYAHSRGLRFGLYWTDALDMADPEGRARRADRIRRLFREHGADMWRSDCTGGEVVGCSFAATRGFYELLDALAAEIPGFQWENCCGGGRIKDHGAMARAVKIFNSDTYSALHVRQAFFDTSHAFHPIQIEGHLGSPDGIQRPRGAQGMRFAFRSMSLGAPEWFLDSPDGGNGADPWTPEEREAVKTCVETYKSRIRPLVRSGDLYHILPRPDGRRWDGIQYWDPAAGKGAAILFKPSRDAPDSPIRLRGLEPGAKYRLTSEDGSLAPQVRTGAELMDRGFEVSLPGDEASEIVFIEREG